MLARIQDDRIAVSGLDDRLADIPGARWVEDEGQWMMPLSWASCIQLRGVLGAELQISPDLNEWAREEIENRVSPCLALRKAQDADLPLFGSLYPFQRAGIAMMVAAQSACNGDDMGLGKSVQAIATLESIGPEAFPALIVCPNSVKAPWVEEWEKWSPGRSVAVVSGTPSQRRKAIAAGADVTIINFEAVRFHSRIAGYGQIRLDEADRVEKELNEREYGAVVIDEAHRIKDPHAKQTRALWWVGKRAKHRFALTGTPLEKSPEDLWALMHFVSPEEYPVKTKWMNRYVIEVKSWSGYKVVEGLKPEHSEELFKILDPRFIRRTKEAVLPQLPPKTYMVRTAQLDPRSKQGKAYKEMSEQMITLLDTGVLMATNPLSQLTRLIQFASCYGELDSNGDLLLSEPSCKVDALEDVVKELGEQQAVIFAESVQLIEVAAARLEKAGHCIGLITGKVPVKERAAAVHDFQEGAIQFLLLTLGAGGEGLTLTAARTAIFLQRSWSAIKNAQAEDRIYGRLSDLHGATIIDIITEGTVEHRVHDTRRKKAERLEEIARDEQTVREWLGAN